jgi:hypothetical protein
MKERFMKFCKRGIKSIHAFMGILISLIILDACASWEPYLSDQPQTKDKAQYRSMIKRDSLYASYPDYRIDSQIHKICIIDNGKEGAHEISAMLRIVFMEVMSPPITILTPGTLKLFLNGKLIDYEKGLTRAEAQAVSDLLQVDHILLFDEMRTAYEDYQFGGTFRVSIRLKIINASNGETIFQSSKTYGARYPDPRPNYHGWMPLSNKDINPLRTACMDMFEFELTYALGGVRAGWAVEKDLEPSAPAVIGLIMKDSPAYRAGIRKGDVVVEVSGNSIQSFSDFNRVLTNSRFEQGNRIVVKVERNGELLDLELEYPYIPGLPPKEIEKDKEMISPSP